MARHHVYPAHERQAWVTWYNAREGRTANTTAEHFSVPVSQVRRALQAGKNSPYATDTEMITEYIERSFDGHPDPYSLAVAIITDALAYANEHNGAMNDSEHTILYQVYEHFRTLDRSIPKVDYR